MRQVLAITGRELRAAFESPVAYATILIFVLVSAGLFYLVGMPIGGMPLPSLWGRGRGQLGGASCLDAPVPGALGSRPLHGVMD